MAKLAHGLLSGDYSRPLTNTDGTEDTTRMLARHHITLVLWCSHTAMLCLLVMVMTTTYCRYRRGGCAAVDVQDAGRARASRVCDNEAAGAEGSLPSSVLM